MKYLIILSTLLLISCGKKTIVNVTENKFDNSNNDNRLTQLEAKNLVIEAKLLSYELKLAELEANGDSLADAIETKYNELFESLDSLEDEIEVNKVELVKVCASNEQLIKVNNKFYAVYMVSNNNGTYLGELASNVQYQTTDNVRARFSLQNNQIVCN